MPLESSNEKNNQKNHLNEVKKPSSKNKDKKKIVKLDIKVKSVSIYWKHIQKMTDFSVRSIPNEAIGLLGGREIRKGELLVEKVIHISTGDEVSVSFSDDDFKSFEDLLNENNHCIGWWHSHPGYGLFLSPTDLTTHIYSFQVHNPLSVALVLDPTRINNQCADFTCYQVKGENGISPFIYNEIASYIIKSKD
ncbi:Mov34/MPN/PAD-1 family protein [Candidatus Hodarchaeum mangrovi]